MLSFALDFYSEQYSTQKWNANVCWVCLMPNKHTQQVQNITIITLNGTYAKNEKQWIFWKCKLIFIYVFRSLFFYTLLLVISNSSLPFPLTNFHPKPYTNVKTYKIAKTTLMWFLRIAQVFKNTETCINNRQEDMGSYT